MIVGTLARIKIVVLKKSPNRNEMPSFFKPHYHLNSPITQHSIFTRRNYIRKMFAVDAVWAVMATACFSSSSLCQDYTFSNFLQDA